MRRILFTLGFLVLVGCHTDDPTFAQVCEVGGTFFYPAGDAIVSDACEDPYEIAWPSVPLRVSLDVEISDYSESLDEALAFWERGVDGVLFVRSSSLDADVHVVLGSASDPGLAATIHDRDGGLLHATIEVRQPGDITEMVYLLAHELGHVVGLAHDPNRTSIMFRSIEDVGLVDEDPDNPFPNLRVTDNDRAALRERYF